MKDMMKDGLKERAKKALQITVTIPEMEDDGEEKEDKAVDRPPELDKSEDKEGIMQGSEPDMKRRAGEKPRGLRDRVRMSMKE